MSRKFTVHVRCSATIYYTIEADSKEEAEKKFYAGQHKDCELELDKQETDPFLITEG